MNSWQARIGVTFLLFFLVLAIVGAFWHPSPKLSIAIDQAPSFQHPVGTDSFGRDVMIRTLSGGYRLIIAAFVAATVAVVVGTVTGAIMSYKKGIMETVVGRGTDIALSFPAILIALLTAAILPPGYLSLCFVTVAIQLPLVIRVSRGIFTEVFSRDFIRVAVLRGDSSTSIICREALPNVASLLLVEFALRWSFSVLIIASLNFLGVGVQPPTADWGLMLYEGRSDLLIAPWAVLAPAVMISMLAVGITFTADAVATATRGAGDVTQWSR